jgi:nitronate monooxygenase
VLLPFARDQHWREVSQADAVVTFWGRPRRRVSGVWLHQCGSVEEALAAREAGADGVVAQGVEAGGHVRGTTPALELLARVRRALGPDYPVWLAGAMATPDDVAEGLGAGADAAVLGTRFLMSPESHAHPGYRDRVAEARETVLTELFGLGWSAAHRVVPNRATARWLRRGDRGPTAIRLINRASGVLRRLPPLDLSARQRPGFPLLSAQMPTDRHPDSLLEAGPLYAGTSAVRIDDVRPAAELTRELASRAP